MTCSCIYENNYSATMYDININHLIMLDLYVYIYNIYFKNVIYCIKIV